MCFLDQARELEDQIIRIRRDIHAHPELGFQEFRTTDLIVRELEALGIEYRRLDPTGVVATVYGQPGSRTVGLRADMDALPVREETGLPFKSTVDGCMHACGHDTHVAMLLGAARLLQNNRERLQGNVRLIFQPAEEIGQGAAAVIRQGGLDGVDAIYALHIGGQALGRIESVKGAMFAASDRFWVKIQGCKCHGAFPHDGVDATLAGAAVVMALHAGIHREFDALEPLVISVGSFHSDGAHNVVAGEAVLEGTVRCYSRQTHRDVQAAIRRMIEHTAAAYRCTAEIRYDTGTDVLINDSSLIDLASACVEKLTGQPLMPGNRLMGSEDFSEYTARIPGAFLTVGAEGQYPSHSGKFQINEEGLKYGAALYAQLAVDALAFLNRH